jgi:hypothetical protein
MKTRTLFNTLLLGSTLLLTQACTRQAVEPEPDEPDGSATFWTDSRTAGGAWIDVYFDGDYAGRITQYRTVAGAPECDSDGFVTVEAAPGSYPYTATGQDGTKWKGTVRIQSEGCSTALIH